MHDIRLVLCETCGSEGRIYRGQYEDERDCGQCPACHAYPVDTYIHLC